MVATIIIHSHNTAQKRMPLKWLHTRLQQRTSTEWTIISMVLVPTAICMHFVCIQPCDYSFGTVHCQMQLLTPVMELVGHGYSKLHSHYLLLLGQDYYLGQEIVKLWNASVGEYCILHSNYSTLT